MKLKKNESYKEYLGRTYPNFENVHSYGPADSFGEISLLTNSCNRAGTIVAKENTYLMVLNYEAF